jgi:D-serine deaminase-like pyridoxal phosphate-dependent protein
VADDTPCESIICLESVGREHTIGEHEAWEREANRPVGDDTPAPTAGRYADARRVYDTVKRDGERVLTLPEIQRVIDAHRAGATPDLTAQQVDDVRRSLSALALAVDGEVYDDVKAAWQPVLAAVAALTADRDTLAEGMVVAGDNVMRLEAEVRALTARLEQAEAEAETYRELGVGQRVIGILAENELLKQDAAEVRALTDEHDAARPVVEAVALWINHGRARPGRPDEWWAIEERLVEGIYDAYDAYEAATANPQTDTP